MPLDGRVHLIGHLQLLQYFHQVYAFFDHYIHLSLSQIATLDAFGLIQLEMLPFASLADAPVAPLPLFAGEVASPGLLLEHFFLLALVPEASFCARYQTQYFAVPIKIIT
jgi:hypothetical protein